MMSWYEIGGICAESFGGRYSEESSGLGLGGDA